MRQAVSVSSLILCPTHRHRIFYQTARYGAGRRE
ncbi:hypothetical protein EcE24377A_4538 [Escherichia coli O139:H28 str. E24377A]|uniref:Uncharacterized protein n=1 Tax=Escherichia coli O139:H28 (strain E24377A / ETEC) TaxID=331111 RepID=A7ZUL2_ECO24|nr:hypothetical protein EcE24377A_4538 [Escherichia coli O139:H28 str. E24377A]